MSRALVTPSALKSGLRIAKRCGEGRAELNCVQVEADGRVTVTDGHRLLSFAGSGLKVDDFPPGEKSEREAIDWPADGILLSWQSVEVILKSCKPDRKSAASVTIMGYLCVETFAKGWVRASSFNGTALSSTWVRASSLQFPKWRRVLPGGNPQYRISVNARYLADMAEALADVADGFTGRITLDFSSPDGCFVGWTPNDAGAFELLMPLRIEEKFNEAGSIRFGGSTFEAVQEQPKEPQPEQVGADSEVEEVENAG